MRRLAGQRLALWGGLIGVVGVWAVAWSGAWSGGLAGIPAPYTPDSVRSVAAGTDGRGNFVVAWVSRHAVLAEGGGEQLHAVRWTGAAWQPLGDLVNEKPQFNAAQPVVHAAPDGSVWLEWEEGSGEAHVDSYLMSNWRDGSDPDGAGSRGAWTSPTPYALRRNLSDAGRSRSFAADPHNQPLVAWTDIGTGTRSVYPSVVSLKLWRGQEWLTTPYLNLNVKTPAFMPSVAQVNGRPSVAYVEGATTRSDLWVRQWDGQAWKTLGGHVNIRPTTYIFKPILRADALGRLTVAWLEDQRGLDALYVSRWNGQRWEHLGGPISAAGEMAATASLAFDARQRPVVAWTQGADGTRQVYAARWDVGKWVRLGSGPLNAQRSNDADHSNVAASGQGVLIVWREREGQTWRIKTRLFP